MLGNIISAGANILGGLLGSKDKDKDRKLQKEFAQHGIRWKVEDAKAAGLHPLAALGAQTTSYSPVSVGGDISSGLAAAGQDIGRAVDATRTQGERVDAYTRTVQGLQLQRLGLENELLASQIAKVRQVGSAPPMPTPGDRYLVEGQADSPLVQTSPMARQASDPSRPHMEAGAVPEIGYSRTPSGWAPVMSKDAKDRLEEDWIGMMQWSLRNRIAPTWAGGSFTPPPVSLAEDEMWAFNPVTGEYQKVIRRGRYGFDRWYQ